MPRSNVVITGMGVVSSIGIGCDAYFQALLDRRSGMTSLANRTDEGPGPGEADVPPGLWVGGPITDFDAKQYVKPRKALKVMCREIQTAFAASQLAVESGGLGEALPADPAGSVKPSELGTVFGGEMYYGPPREMEDTIRACIEAGNDLAMICHRVELVEKASEVIATLSLALVRGGTLSFLQRFGDVDLRDQAAWQRSRARLHLGGGVRALPGVRGGGVRPRSPCDLRARRRLPRRRLLDV